MTHRRGLVALAAIALVLSGTLSLLEHRLETWIEGDRPGLPPWERADEARRARERGENRTMELLEKGVGRLLKRDLGTELEEGKAWEYFEHWYGIRAYPNELIPKAAYYEAWQHAEAVQRPTRGRTGAEWTSIGPDNIGGRMLALAIDPVNPEILWAGAASGGLWKSTTGGEGAAAWTRIETGFPSLSVSSILVDPTNPQILYLGTGEISLYARPLNGTPGARASYGIGILKSLDGGMTWQETGLTWSFDQHRVVLSMRFAPNDPNTIWAATSEGLYRTTDGGATWELKHDVLMAMDVVIDPMNPNKIFVAHGQLNSTPDPGLYRSTDGGDSWALLAGGLPVANFGRTPLAIRNTVPGGPATVYAGVSDANTRQVIGLFRSTNDGANWSNLAGVNWAGGQAWYDNVIGVSQHNPNLVLCGGLDWYRSTNGGSSLGQVSYWYNGYMGEIPPGGAEGPGDYVHADQHAIAFHPTNGQIVYVGSDGGIFKSTDGGATWEGKNGGLVTTQFYAGFAGGYGPSGIAVGGLQDNGTIKYTGSPSWSKIFGGDGGWCAIDPRDEEVIYEEYVYLNMYKSLDGGANWQEIHPYSSGEANFIAPFVIAESAPDILYAGTRGVKRTTNGGTSWSYPDGNSNWNGTAIASFVVAFTSADTLMAGTGSGSASAVVEIRRSTNGGQSWTDVTVQLPNRYPTDFGYSRTDSRQVWATFAGFGTGHVFRSTDAGLTWTDRSGNLPDIPVQCVAVDPRGADQVYVGTDLGIFYTIDGGQNWLDLNAGMPLAQVLDLVMHMTQLKMRAATFGNGVYEIDLLGIVSGIEEEAGGSNDSVEDQAQGSAFLSWSAGPNPFRDATTIRFRLARQTDVRCTIHDPAGRIIRTLNDRDRTTGKGEMRWDGRDESGRRVAAGTYFARLTAGSDRATIKLAVMK